MSTVANLPASAVLLTGNGNEWEGSQDTGPREEYFSWYCLWSDSNAFYQTVVGTVQTISYGGYSVTRRVPLQHPYDPSLWAIGMSWKGINGPGATTLAPFAYVQFRIKFGYPGYSVDGEEPSSDQSGAPPFIKVACRKATRTVTDTARQYSYTPSGGGSAVKLKHDVGVQFGGANYDVTLLAVPSLANFESVAAPIVGMVNSQPITIGGYQRSSGTVLFETYGYDYEQDVAGNAQWTVSLSLNCSSLPWNSYLVGGQQVSLTPAPYQSTDLNALYM